MVRGIPAAFGCADGTHRNVASRCMGGGSRGIRVASAARHTLQAEKPVRGVFLGVRVVSRGWAAGAGAGGGMPGSVVAEGGEPAAGGVTHGGGVARGKERDQAVLVGEVCRERAVDELDALGGEAHEAPAAIVLGIRADDEAALDQTVDPLRESAGGDHRVVGQFTRRQLVRRTGAAKRCQEVELRLAQPELRVDGGQLGRQRRGQAMDAADHALRRGIEIGAFAAPLLLDEVDVILHTLDITFRGSYILFRGR